MGRGKSAENRTLIRMAAEILREIAPASVRAVCYQLFNRKLIPSMSKKDTNRVSVQLRDARERGYIPWEWIVDETREAECVNAWKDPSAYVKTVTRGYRRDRWADQPERIEVWSEKGTVRGTLAPILHEYGVTFRVMHGYGSATAIHEVATESRSTDKPWIVFYVGDWDPSGLHMSEVDIPNRLVRYGGDIEIKRIALNVLHVSAGDLPWFAATDKQHDARYRWYVGRYGRKCWELDALSPKLLRNTVAAAIRDRLNVDAWDRAEVVEAAERESLRTILDAWPSISGQAHE